MRTEFGGVWARVASTKLGPLLISATVDASNFINMVHNLDLVSSLPRNNFRTKINGDLC